MTKLQAWLFSSHAKRMLYTLHKSCEPKSWLSHLVYNPPCWIASYALGHPKQRRKNLRLLKLLFWRLYYFVFQPGSFCTRVLLACSRLSVDEEERQKGEREKKRGGSRLFSPQLPRAWNRLESCKNGAEKQTRSVPQYCAVYSTTLSLFCKFCIWIFNLPKVSHIHISSPAGDRMVVPWS